MSEFEQKSIDAALAALLRPLLREAVRDALRELREDIGGADARPPSSVAPPGALLTVEQVAARVNVRPATVREWIRTGYLPALQVGPGGRRYAIRPDDLDRVLEKRSGSKPMDSKALAMQIVRSARSRAR